MSALYEYALLAEKRHADLLRWEGAREAARVMAAMLDAVGGEIAIPRASLLAVDEGEPYFQREDGDDYITYRLVLKDKR